MGILDDAIREHLDLKRRLGAEEDELQRLEGEAFGPPSRPGDPDFPEQGPAAEAAAEPVTGEAPAAPPADAAAEPASEELPPEPPPTAEEPLASAPETAPAVDTGAAEPAQPADELDLDLELELDEQGTLDGAPDAAPPEPATGGTDDRAAVEPDAAAQEPPIESLDTVEHPFEGAITETGEAEVVEGELADDAEDEEDVLEETPEFLRDAPEDDELWFEQGEPKDFDF